MGIARRFTITLATSLLVASSAGASDASIEREAALQRQQQGAGGERAANERSRASGEQGSVLEVSETHIVLMTSQGDAKTYELSPGTDIRRGSAPVTILEVDTGETAFVRAMYTATGEQVATSISVAPKTGSQ
jgi:hypothetical protein